LTRQNATPCANEWLRKASGPALPCTGDPGVMQLPALVVAVLTQWPGGQWSDKKYCTTCYDALYRSVVLRQHDWVAEVDGVGVSYCISSIGLYGMMAYVEGCCPTNRYLYVHRWTVDDSNKLRCSRTSRLDPGFKQPNTSDVLVHLAR
jgi:hypothetical protein